jgi:sulfatase maturation enzyme AslB (radical SAM superfamily)
VRETPLLDILNSNELLLTLRKRDALKGKCGRCRYKQTCGGCRAVTYYRTGDYLESDPTCFFEPVDETTVSEFESLQNRNAKKFIHFVSRHDPWKSLFNGNARRSGWWNSLKQVLHWK